MKAFLAVACMWALLASPAAALETPGLYDDFTYGMPAAEVARVSGARPCEQAGLEGSLCRRSVKYGGSEWTQVFVIEDEKLSSVMLVGANDEGRLQKTLNCLNDDGYFMVMGVKDNYTLDSMMMAAQGSELLQRKLDDFFALNYESMTCIFMEFSMIEEVAKKVETLSSIRALMNNAPMGTREVDILCNSQSMMVKFTAPVIARLQAVRKAKEAKEQKELQ